MAKSMALAGAAIAATLAMAMSAVSVVAQDLISQRQAYMKSAARAAKTGSDMIRGTIPFNAKKAAVAMAVIAAGSGPYAKMFPPGSSLGETRASPKIFQNPAAFEARAKKLGDDATAAQKAAANGPEAFKAAFDEVGKNCVGCHDEFRALRR